MEEEKGEAATAWEVPKILTETENKTLLWTAASPWRWPALEGPSGAGGLWREQVCFPSGKADCHPREKMDCPHLGTIKFYFC